MGPISSWGETGEIGAGPPSGPPWWLAPLVGLTVVGLLLWTGHAEGALLLLALVTALTLARLVSPSFDRRLSWLLGRVAHGAGRLLAWLLLGGVTVLVVVPVWVVTRLGRYDPLDIGAADAGRWDDGGRRWWHRRPDQPFTREARRPGRRRLHAAGLVLVPLGALLLLALPARHFVADLRAPSSGPAPVPSADGGDQPVAAPDTPWEVTGTGPQRDGDPLLAQTDEWAAEALAGRVQVTEYDPTNILRIRDAHTEYFNYEDRVRRSWEPPTDDPGLDVWFFGSSMLLGPSVIRDDHTVASEVARAAWEQGGIPVRASNFAIGGYETWQQTVLMAQMLTERPAPDLVVFYGGYNDLHNYITPGAPTEVSNTWAGDFERALEDSGATLQVPAEDSVARTTGWDPANAAAVYDRGIEVAQDLLRARGIPFANFLQPCLWTREAEAERATLAQIGTDEEYRASFGAVYDAARAAITVPVVDLSDVLDDLAGIVYWDEVHHNEAGTAAAGQAVERHLRPQLQALWADGNGGGPTTASTTPSA
ncbi:MAG: hypothetical protein H6518_10960 [Microthrixaceae bacterium]|nr:hypothetical protein [Microthrixaceae bacterium]